MCGPLVVLPPRLFLTDMEGNFEPARICHQGSLTSEWSWRSLSDIKQTSGSVGIGHLEQRPLCGGKTNLPPYPHVCSQRICIRTSNTDILIVMLLFPAEFFHALGCCWVVELDIHINGR